MLLVLSTGIIAQETHPVPETPVTPATPDTTRIKLGTLNVTIVDEGEEGDIEQFTTFHLLEFGKELMQCLCK